MRNINEKQTARQEKIIYKHVIKVLTVVGFPSGNKTPKIFRVPTMISGTDQQNILA